MKYYHYIFNVYKGIYALTNKELKSDLITIFHNIAKEKGLEIIRLSVAGDHVHVLIKQNNYDSTGYVMKVIKGASARHLFRKYKTNRFYYRKLWGRSYHAEEIDSTDIKRVSSYIKGQTIFGVDKRFLSRNREVYSQVP